MHRLQFIEEDLVQKFDNKSFLYYIYTKTSDYRTAYDDWPIGQGDCDARPIFGLPEASC
jgi:hypothetical protein